MIEPLERPSYAKYGEMKGSRTISKNNTDGANMLSVFVPVYVSSRDSNIKVSFESMLGLTVKEYNRK